VGLRSGWMGGWVGGWADEKTRGVYGSSSLVKQKKKGKNYAVFYIAGNRFFFLYLLCDYFTGKRKTLQYSLLVCV
jgi:hypothetical protein